MRASKHHIDGRTLLITATLADQHRFGRAKTSTYAADRASIPLNEIATLKSRRI